MRRAICWSCTARLLYTFCPASAGFCSGWQPLKAQSPVRMTAMGCASWGIAWITSSTARGTPACIITDSLKAVSSGLQQQDKVLTIKGGSHSGRVCQQLQGTL